MLIFFLNKKWLKGQMDIVTDKQTRQTLPSIDANFLCSHLNQDQIALYFQIK